jgi:hypothetical protein
LHTQALAPLNYERTAGETEFFSAPVEALFSTSASNRLWGQATENLRSIVEADMFQGLTVLALCALALWGLRREPFRRRWVLGYALLAVCAFLVALGPEVRLFGASIVAGPFAWLREFEVFRMIRVPARGSVFVGLALSMLASFGLEQVRSRVLQLVLVGIMLLEATVAPLNVVAADRCIDASDAIPPVYAWLAAQPADEPVLELPLLPNDGLFPRPKFDDSVYLLRSVTHWKPLVNGYAGTEPRAYGRLRESMKDFPSEASIALLRALKVRYVLIHLRGFGPNRREAIEAGLKVFSPTVVESARLGDDVALEIPAPKAAVSPH